MGPWIFACAEMTRRCVLASSNVELPLSLRSTWRSKVAAFVPSLPDRFARARDDQAFAIVLLNVYDVAYHTHASEIPDVRTNIEIDDELMAQALKLTGLPTKRAVVEEGLRLMVRLRKQARALKSLKGLGWEGDLDEIRQDRPSRPL